MSRKARVVVIGAAGGVGRGIARAMLERYASAIASLVVTSRDPDRLEQLQASLDGNPLVEPVIGSVATFDEACRLREAAFERGPADVVVASLGGWWSGTPFLEIDDAAWLAGMSSLLTVHAVCARAFVPYLTAENTKYLLIGGGAALRPVRGSSLVSIAGAAQTMLARSLAAEQSIAQWPLIHELVVDSPVATHAAHHGPVTENEITALDVGRAVARWCLGGTVRARFDWPRDLLDRDGAITIMRRR